MFTVMMHSLWKTFSMSLANGNQKQQTTAFWDHFQASDLF